MLFTLIVASISNEKTVESRDLQFFSGETLSNETVLLSFLTN